MASDTNLPPVPTNFRIIEPAQAAQVAPAPGSTLRLFTLKYDNKPFHDIYWSTDRVTWKLLLKNCYGTPQGELTVTNGTKTGFVKVVGHENYIP